MITAEDVLIKKGVLLKTIEESGNFPLNLTRDTHIGSAKKIKQAMIEFAEFHVREALKQASEEAYTKSEMSYTGGMGGRDLYESIEIIDKDSILNAYPLENIK